MLKFLLNRAVTPAVVALVLFAVPVSVPASDRVVVHENTVVNSIRPHFFGFNLEWIPFQIGFVRVDGSVDPKLIGFLSVFQGAYYRFPGGTAANMFRWESAVGSSGKRSPQKTPWGSHLRSQFGLAEYLDFVKAVRGKPWYVVNVLDGPDCNYGVQGVLPCSHSAATSLASLHKHMMAVEGAADPTDQDGSFCSAGAPCLIRSWELGNELDHGKNGISAENYVQASRRVYDQIKALDPSANVVAHLATAPWQRFQTKSEAFNQTVLSELGPDVSGLAVHLYYDGISTSRAAKFATVKPSITDGDTFPQVWVTEHAKWPAVDPYKESMAFGEGPTNWQGALSNADFLIKLSRISNVAGAMTHALAAKGPWKLFQYDASGSLLPSATFHVLSLLRQTMVGEALLTEFADSPDFEVQAYRMEKSGRLAVVSVNRSGVQRSISLELPERGNATLAASIICGFSKTMKALSCGESQTAGTSLLKLGKSEGGVIEFSVAPYSVVSIGID